MTMAANLGKIKTWTHTRLSTSVPDSLVTLTGRGAMHLGSATTPARNALPRERIIMSDHGLSHADMLAVGISQRRLEWWTRQGWLFTEKTQPGSGRPRVWLDGEDIIGALMIPLVDAGLAPAAASRVARGGDLAPGIKVVINLTDAS